MGVACSDKFSIVAATLPPTGGQAEMHRIETTEKAIRRFIDRLGHPPGLAVCMRPGPAGLTCCACSGASAWHLM